MGAEAMEPKSMTPEDWHQLAELCLDRAAAYENMLKLPSDRRVCVEAEASFRALASKCAEREAALREGRVMP
jgi:hypothetical protein